MKTKVPVTYSVQFVILSGYLKYWMLSYLSHFDNILIFAVNFLASKSYKFVSLYLSPYLVPFGLNGTSAKMKWGMNSQITWSSLLVPEG